jgi:hypothetical protein
MKFYFNSYVGTLPILPLIVFSTLPFHESYLNSVPCHAFYWYHLYLCHLYISPCCLLYTCPIKSSFFTSNWELYFTHFPLDVSYSLPLELSTPSFNVFCLLSPLRLWSYLDVVVCVPLKTSLLPSQFEGVVLLTLCLVITSSLPRANLALLPFFVVLIPFVLLYLYLFS